MADRTVAVALIARVQGYTAGLKTAALSTKEFGGELDAMKAKNSAAYDKVVSGAAMAGAALVGLAGWAIKTSMQFDKSMSEVGAITGATADDMGKLRKAALDAGQATVFSATEAANAEAELGKAGLSTADILGGGLTGALSLAAAGTLGLEEAASVAAKTMGQFQLAGKDVAHIADVLAGASNATATDVHELGFALAQSGTVAHSSGMSFDDTATALAAFAKNALTGSDAGTSLKTLLLQMQGPSEVAANLMKEYGFSIYDTAGNMVSIYEIADRLQKSFKGVTAEQRNYAFAQIFGNDAARSANILYQNGATGLHKVNGEMMAQADAAKVAQQKTDNLVGDVERLKGSLETLFITSSEGANGGLRIIVQALDHLVGSFEKIPAPIQSAIVILAGVSGAALLAAAAFLKVRKMSGEAFDALAQGGQVSERFAGSMKSVVSWVGKATAAFGILVASGSAVSAAFGKDIDPNMDALTKSLIEFGESGQAAGAAADLFGDKLEDLDYDLGTLGSGALAKTGNAISGFIESTTGLGSVFDESLKHARQRLTAIDQALTQMVNSGHGDEAAAVFDRLAQEAQKSGISLDDLKAGLPGYVAAYQDFTGKTGAAYGQLDAAWQQQSQSAKDAADATGSDAMAAKSQAAMADDARLANIRLAGAFGAAASEADGLKNAFDDLNSVTLTWMGAEDSVEAAFDSLTDSFKKNGRSLDAGTEAGRENREALIALAQAARDATQAKFNETGSVTEADKVYEQYRQRLIKLAQQEGFTRKQAEDLVNSIMAMPSDKTITVSVNVKYRTGGNLGALELPDQFHHAQGGVVDYYANGGENHVAQIAPAGAMRVWSEPETGGEAYIPLATQKRARSMAVLQDVARRFNMPLGGYAQQVQVSVSTAPGADSRLLGGVLQFLRFEVDTKHAGNAQAALSRRR